MAMEETHPTNMSGVQQMKNVSKLVITATMFAACSGELQAPTDDTADAFSDAVHMTCFCTNGTHTISAASQSDCESNNPDDSPSPWSWLCTWSWQ
jgi:hypothetical protein